MKKILKKTSLKFLLNNEIKQLNKKKKYKMKYK